MKIFINIFALYMLTLAFVPCGDNSGIAVNIVGDDLRVELSTDNSHHNHSKDCGDDLCSPFCYCTCCVSMLDLPSDFQPQIKKLEPATQLASYNVSNFIYSDLINSIWRPPANI